MVAVVQTLHAVLPRECAVRSSLSLLHACNERIDANIKNIYKELEQVEQTRSLLLSCRHTYVLPEQVQHPVFQKVLALASKAGFKEEEATFIQYHQIAGRKYVFIADDHDDERYQNLGYSLKKAAKKRQFAIFCEAICHDDQSETVTSYWKGPPSEMPWIFGLEGPGRALQHATYLFYQFCNSSKPEEEADTKQAKAAITNTKTAVSVITSFLVDILTNSPWDAVLQKALDTDSFKNETKALFDDILEMLGAEMSLEEKMGNLFPKLWEKHPYVERWKDLFFGLAMICLKLPNQDFTSAEIQVVKNILIQPKNGDVAEEFFGKIMFAMRNRTFARVLFDTSLPRKIVRIAKIGYKHVPGVICDLERLATSSSKA